MTNQRMFPFARNPANEKRRQRLDNARLQGTHTQQEWEELKARYDHRCVRCWKTAKLTKDHITPICDDGSDAIDNIQPLCRPCNSWAGGTSIDFRLLRDCKEEWISPNNLMPMLNQEAVVMLRNKLITVAKLVTLFEESIPRWKLRTNLYRYAAYGSVTRWTNFE